MYLSVIRVADSKETNIWHQISQYSALYRNKNIGLRPGFSFLFCLFTLQYEITVSWATLWFLLTLYSNSQNHSPSLFFQYFIEPNSFSHSFTARSPLESWPFPALSLLNLPSSWSCLCVSLAAFSFLLCAWQTARREGKGSPLAVSVLCATVASSCRSYGWNSAQPAQSRLQAGHCRWAL